MFIFSCPWLLLVSQGPGEHQLKYRCRHDYFFKFCLLLPPQLCQCLPFIELRIKISIFFSGLPLISVLLGHVYRVEQVQELVTKTTKLGIVTVVLACPAIAYFSDTEQEVFQSSALILPPVN